MAREYTVILDTMFPVTAEHEDEVSERARVWLLAALQNPQVNLDFRIMARGRDEK